MIRVLVVDDQALIREGLAMMLGLYDHIHLVDMAANGLEALEILKEKDVDLILMDIRMPLMDGIEATDIIRKKYPQVKIIILTTFDEDEYIFHGLKNGAHAYLLKDIGSQELVKAIEAVQGGSVLLEPDIASKMLDSFRPTSKKDLGFDQLTRREKEIALLVSQGKTNRQIADELFITEGTVKNHLTKVLDKLELRDRTQLALQIKNKG